MNKLKNIISVVLTAIIAFAIISLIASCLVWLVSFILRGVYLLWT